MNIVYAAEKNSIAGLLGEYLHEAVDPGELEVVENPGETGSFFIGWQQRRFLLSPAGELSRTLPGRR